MIFNERAFFIGEKNLMFDQRKPFMDQLVELSRKLKKNIYIWILGFDCSHIVLKWKKIKNENGVCGAKPKLAKFDQKKPFMDELVELSRKIKKWHIYGIRVLIAVT